MKELYAAQDITILAAYPVYFGGISLNREPKLVDYGATVYPVTEEQLAAAAEKVRAEVWPEIVKDNGEDWANDILSRAGQ